MVTISSYASEDSPAIMPEPFRFSTPRPLSFPMISVMTYLQEPNTAYRPSSSPERPKAGVFPQDPRQEGWAIKQPEVK